MSAKPDVMWWIQSNLNNSIDLIQALVDEGILWAATPIVPWSNEIPDFGVAERGRQIICYGSTSTIEAIRRSDKYRYSIWQDPNIFKPSKCFEMWGDLCLNHQAEVMTIREFLGRGDLGVCFVKPNNDIKNFSGRPDFCYDWEKELSARGEDLDLEIVVSEVQTIDQEWRFWIVDNHIVTESKYKERGQFCTKIDKNYDLIRREDGRNFVEKLKDTWNPALAYCLDIGVVDDKYKLIELTSINSAGFYKADVNAIVLELTRAVKEREQIKGSR